MLVIAGLYFGFKDPWNQSDAELKKSQQLLISKKHLVRTDLVVGDRHVAGLRVRRPLDRLRVAERLGADEEEGCRSSTCTRRRSRSRGSACSCCCKGSPRAHLAHAYVDAWSSTKSAKWLEDNYGYGHANSMARPSSSDLLRALQLTNPRAVTEPNAHLDRDIPRRALYAKLWEQVKAS